MKRYIIIPVRQDSQRLPGKALLPIQGKPMVLRVWEQALKVPHCDVIVATNSHTISELVTKAGGNICWTANTHRNGMERCAEAARQLNLDNSVSVMNLQADMPFIDSDILGAVFDRIPFSGVVTACTQVFGEEKSWRDINDVKAVLSRNQQVLYFSRQPIPYILTKPAIKEYFPIWYKHIGVYAMRNHILQLYAHQKQQSDLEVSEHLEQLRFYDLNIPITTFITDLNVYSVNTLEDYQNLPQIEWPEQTTGHVI